MNNKTSRVGPKNESKKLKLNQLIHKMNQKNVVS